MVKKRSLCLAAGVFAATWALSATQGHGPVAPSPSPSASMTSTTEVSQDCFILSFIVLLIVSYL